jgi:hypothetical protein
MTIKVLDRLDDGQVEDAWGLYHEAFQEVNALAVQRHLMYRSEFEAMMGDPRVDKYLYLDHNGCLRGLATYTNDLDAVPLISPAYFARRWPEHYAQRRIWYVGFVCVASDAPGGFGEIVEALYRVVADTGGVVGLDFCQYNEQVRQLPQRVQTLLERLAADVQVERADSQSYWTYEFTQPGGQQA